MANRTRTNRNEFHLNDDEQYILDEKFKLSGMKSKSAFLRKLILYGYVYDVDYSYLRNYNHILKTIRSSQKGTAENIIKREKLFSKYIEEAKKVEFEYFTLDDNVKLENDELLDVQKQIQSFLKFLDSEYETVKKIETLNPISVMSRGFSLAYNDKGQIATASNIEVDYETTPADTFLEIISLGFYNSANEISGIISILTPFLFVIVLSSKTISTSALYI